MKHLLLVVTCVLCASTSKANWRQFRGNEGTGEARGESLPTDWNDGGDGKIAWCVDLPGRGVSSPIVDGQLVIVTASSGFRRDRLHVLAFDAETGELRWQRQFWATGRTLCHPTMAVAAPTPTSDGKRVAVFYSSNDLACFDLAGKLLWLRGLGYDYPTAANDVGMASSPILVDGTLVVQVENKGDSFVAGVAADTGLTRWRHDREQAMNWTSPALCHDGERSLVLVQSPGRLTAYNPSSGKLVWEHTVGCAVIPSVVASGRTAYVPAAGLTALAIGGEKPGVIWQENKLGASNSSPVVAGQRVYTINSAPALSCADAASGEVLWRARLSGPFWATPLVARDKLYCVSDKGMAQVVDLAAKGKVISQFDFAEPILASPAASDGAIYFRSDGHLWKVSAKN